MQYWEGPSRWINTILLVVVGFIAFDALFLLLDAQDSNAIVRLVGSFAGLFLAPFEGMFADQSPILTSAIAVLGYCLLAGIALAVTRSIQASMRASAVRREQREQLAAEDARQLGDAYDAGQYSTGQGPVGYGQPSSQDHRQGVPRGTAQPGAPRSTTPRPSEARPGDPRRGGSFSPGRPGGERSTRG